jgi:hypothetical protein
MNTNDNDNDSNTFTVNQNLNNAESFNNGFDCDYPCDGYNNNDDKFAHLKAIAAGDIPAPTLSSDIRFWTHEPNNPLIGTILGFDKFEHPSYGTQKTIIIERETGDVVSAILTNYLQKGMEIQNGQIGDLALIEKKGKKRSNNGAMYNEFQLVIEKTMRR